MDLLGKKKVQHFRTNSYIIIFLQHRVHTLQLDFRTRAIFSLAKIHEARFTIFSGKKFG